MSYHHFTILFVIIFAVFFLKMQVVVSKYEQSVENYAKMERSFYAAADVAGEALCQFGTSGIIMDKRAAYDSFLASLYASLDIMDKPAQREELAKYIPMFAVLDVEGFYIFFEDEYEKADGFHSITRNWTERMPYSYCDEDFAYNFSLDGMVTIYDKQGLIDGTIRLYQSTQKELREDCAYETLRALRPNSFLFDAASFKKVKQTAVITSVQNAMRYYINNYNRIADAYEITYEFSLPVIDNSVWFRSIEHPGVFIMIQGYPLDISKNLVFNQYAFVGAQIYKKEPYYLTEQGWHLTYHREGCEQLSRAGEEVFRYPYDSVEDCVKKGAYACKICVPDEIHPPESLYSICDAE